MVSRNPAKYNVCVCGGVYNCTRQPVKSRQLSMTGWMPSVCYSGQKSSSDSWSSPQIHVSVLLAIKTKSTSKEPSEFLDRRTGALTFTALSAHLVSHTFTEFTATFPLRSKPTCDGGFGEYRGRQCCFQVIDPKRCYFRNGSSNDICFSLSLCFVWMWNVPHGLLWLNLWSSAVCML